MATATQGNYIKFVSIIITVVVMIFRRVIAAIGTGETRRFRHGSCADGVVNKVVGFLCIGIRHVERSGVSVLAAVFGSSSFDFGTSLVFSVFFAGAFFAAASTPTRDTRVFLELLQWSCCAAPNASFGFHKNASCQQGVSACV